jgi:outer membrane protein assembly factor BamB
VNGPERPTRKWEVELPGSIRGTISIDSTGSIYLGGDNGTLHQIHGDGNYHTIKLPMSKTLGTPTIGLNGILYLGTTGDWRSVGHKLIAMHQDGKVEWEVNVENLTTYQPVLDNDGTVYITTHGSMLFAVNPRGEIKWVYKKKFEFWSVPIISENGTIYIGSGENKLYSLNREGKETGSIFVGHGGSQFSPIIDEANNIYVCTNIDNRNKLLAIGPKMKILWEFLPQMGDVVTNPALGNNDILYMMANYERLIAIDKKGLLQWECSIDGFTTHYPPIVGFDGTIFTGTFTNVDGIYISWINAVSPEGSKKWVYQFEDEVLSSFVLGDKNTIYALVNNPAKNVSKVYAIGESI